MGPLKFVRDETFPQHARKHNIVVYGGLTLYAIMACSVTFGLVGGLPYRSSRCETPEDWSSSKGCFYLEADGTVTRTDPIVTYQEHNDVGLMWTGIASAGLFGVVGICLLVFLWKWHQEYLEFVSLKEEKLLGGEEGEER